MSDSVFVHPTAHVAVGVKLGQGVKIWQNCVVLAGAEIGDRSQLSANVFIEGRVCVGRDVKVKNNITLYDGVTIEDGVFLGPSAVFTNVLTPRSRWPRKTAFLPTRVEEGATVGANATIVCGVTIGRHGMVGAGSVVTRDVAAFSLVYGAPARQTGYVCQCGTPLRPPDPAHTCLSCGSRYRLDGTALVPVELAAPREL